jgi:hypothetical protein
MNEKFKPWYMYDYIQNGLYVDVIDSETGEFMFRDDTSALAKEYIQNHQG